VISPRCRFNQQRRSSKGANTVPADARCETHTAVETLMVLLDCLTPLKIEPVSICTSHSTSCSIAVASPASPLRSGSSLYPCLNSSKIIDYRASTIAAFLCNRRIFPLIRANGGKNGGNYGVPRSPLGSGYASGKFKAVLTLAYPYRSAAVDGIYRPNKSCCSVHRLSNASKSRVSSTGLCERN
jgi:hypothetical protein